MKKLTEYGFAQEEVEDIAFSLALFDKWAEKEFEEMFDDRYHALIKDFAHGIPFAQALVTGFLGGFEKGLEIGWTLEKEKEKNR